MYYWFLIILFCLNAYSNDPYDLNEEELSPDSQEVLLGKPEKHLRHESMIYDFNTDLGIKDQRRYTGEDRNRFSIAGHISGDYEHFNDILGFDFTYMHRSNRYHRAWYGFQLFRHNTYFDNITQNPSSGSNPDSDANNPRPNNQENTVSALGLGAGYRFKLLMEFWDTEDVFESVDVFANYLVLNESFINKTYQGYGLSTNYGIHKRTSSRYFYGGKFSYNIGSVKRAAIGTESETERSLSLGWLTLAFELGFFF